MLRVSRLADYATSLMACLGKDPEAVTSAVDLAECLELEPPTVSKLLKMLAKAGLVESFRGAHGGYRLARAAGDISVADVVEAVDGPIGLTDCGVRGRYCGREARCGVRGNWQRINATVATALRSVSVADMVHPDGSAAEVPATLSTHAS